MKKFVIDELVVFGFVLKLKSNILMKENTPKKNVLFFFPIPRHKNLFSPLMLVLMRMITIDIENVTKKSTLK